MKKYDITKDNITSKDILTVQKFYSSLNKSLYNPTDITVINQIMKLESQSQTEELEYRLHLARQMDPQGDDRETAYLLLYAERLYYFQVLGQRSGDRAVQRFPAVVERRYAVPLSTEPSVLVRTGCDVLKGLAAISRQPSETSLNAES